MKAVGSRADVDTVLVSSIARDPALIPAPFPWVSVLWPPPFAVWGPPCVCGPRRCGVTTLWPGARCGCRAMVPIRRVHHGEPGSLVGTRLQTHSRRNTTQTGIRHHERLPSPSARSNKVRTVAFCGFLVTLSLMLAIVGVR